MLKRYSILILFSIIFTSCGLDPVAFNDSLVHNIDMAHRQRKILDEQIIKQISNLDLNNDAPDININTSSIIDSLNTYIENVQILEEPDNGTRFKTSVVIYLKSLLNITKSYKNISKITIDSSKEEIDSIINPITKQEKTAESLLENVIKEQSIFLNQIENQKDGSPHKINNIEKRD